MVFGRRLSYPGSKLKLFLTLRDTLTKSKVNITSPGVVKIYDKNPKNISNQTPIATLIPGLLSTGILFVEWEVPVNLAEGIYFDSWEEIQTENLKNPEEIIQQFYVSEEIYSSEIILENTYEVKCSKRRIYTDSKEYVVFNLKSPEGSVFHATEARILTSGTNKVSAKVVLREVGPGLNPVVNSNALFPQDPVVILEETTEEKTRFFDIPSIDNKAYFIWDTTSLKEGTYKVQLKFSVGEEEHVTRTFSIIIEDPL